MTCTELTPEGASAVLIQASAVVGIDASRAGLVRLGSNAVFRLSAELIARVARGGQVDDVRRMVAVARWLASEGYPSVRALDVDQPVVVDGMAVTFWDAVSDDGDTYASTQEVAETLVRLHRLTPPDELKLSDFDPFGSIDERIAANTWLSDADRTFLADQLADARERYGRLDFALPEGVIHGDANVGNVLKDGGGHPVVIDLDEFAIGPREWDLIQTAVFYDDFGWHTAEEYRAFVDVYGFDIMQWPGYPVLRDIRELHMVTWLAQNAGHNERSATETAKRVATLRTGASRRNWSPY